MTICQSCWFYMAHWILYNSNKSFWHRWAWRLVTNYENMNSISNLMCPKSWGINHKEGCVMSTRSNRLVCGYFRPGRVVEGEILGSDEFYVWRRVEQFKLLLWCWMENNSFAYYLFLFWWMKQIWSRNSVVSPLLLLVLVGPLKVPSDAWSQNALYMQKFEDKQSILPLPQLCFPWKLSRPVRQVFKGSVAWTEKTTKPTGPNWRQLGHQLWLLHFGILLVACCLLSKIFRNQSKTSHN